MSCSMKKCFLVITSVAFVVLTVVIMSGIQMDIQMSSKYLKPVHTLDKGVSLPLHQGPHITDSESRNNASMTKTSNNTILVEMQLSVDSHRDRQNISHWPSLTPERTKVLNHITRGRQNVNRQALTPAHTTKGNARKNDTKALLKTRYANIEATTSTGYQATDVKSVVEGGTLPEADCTKRLLIFECSGKLGCAGLADRQRGLMSSFLLALLLNRTFSIKFTRPCPLSNYFVPNKYDWLKCLSKYNTSSDIRYINLFDKRETNKFPNIAEYPRGNIWKERIVVIRTNWFFYRNITNHASAKDTVPWLLRRTLYSVEHRVFHILFQLETSFKLEIDRYIDNLTRHKSRDLVGVHIRTEFINVDDDLNNIFNFVDTFNDTSKYAIYIATDNEEVRLKALNRFKGSFSSNVSGITLHVDSGRATCTSLHLAAFEQQVLARSNIIIKTHSGFSMTSVFIRGRGLTYRYTTPTEKGAGPYFKII